MATSYETMRQYIISKGWTTVPMKEGNFQVVGWKNEKYGRFCQDIADAYAITKLNVEVTLKWKI